VAVTDCLNFGNPERPEVYYNMQAVIHGIADACRALSTPVISGNVSLYNETSGGAIYPTPVIGMLGILDDVTAFVGMGFADEGDDVFVLGSHVEQPVASLGGSEYLRQEHRLEGGRLTLDLALEERVQRAALAAIRQGLATACHDCSDGGLAVALAEMSLAGNKGLDGRDAYLGQRLDAALFGEAQSRIVVAVKPENRGALETIVRGLSVPIEIIGRVSAEPRFRLGPVDLPLTALREPYEGGLRAALNPSR
jgi:phosphoribosylformylglycinamidine synthase